MTMKFSSAFNPQSTMAVPSLNKTRSRKIQMNSLQLGVNRYNDILKESMSKSSPRERDSVQYSSFNYPEVADEVCCYIQRTFQLLDLYIKIGVFDKSHHGVLGELPGILKGNAGFGLSLIKLS